MTYLALALLSILTIFFAISHEEQKHKTSETQKLLRIAKRDCALIEETLEEYRKALEEAKTLQSTSDR